MTDPTPGGEPTPLRAGVILYYSSCAAVGIAAAATAMVLVVFPNESFAIPVGIMGALIILGGGFGAWYFLRIARQEQ